MKKSRYQEEQIIALLKEVGAGARVQDAIFKLGLTTPYEDGSGHQKPGADSFRSSFVPHKGPPSWKQTFLVGSWRQPGRGAGIRSR